VARRLLIGSAALVILLLLPFVLLRAAYPDFLAFSEGEAERANPPFEVTLDQDTTEPDAQSSKDTQKELPSAEGPASDVAIAVVRVSGTPGAVYSGSYGTSNRMEQAEGILEAQPAYYVAAVRRNSGDTVDAKFQKLNLGTETLKAEILIDSEVVDQEETSSDFGTVEVSWSPKASSQ
jgi:hypothetical protein